LLKTNGLKELGGRGFMVLSQDIIRRLVMKKEDFLKNEIDKVISIQC